MLLLTSSPVHLLPSTVFHMFPSISRTCVIGSIAVQNRHYPMGKPCLFKVSNKTGFTTMLDFDSQTIRVYESMFEDRLEDDLSNL